KVPRPVTPEIKKHLGEFLSRLPERVDRAPFKEFKIFEAKGCEKCGNIGYKGRVAIFEFLRITEEVGQLVYKEASEAAVKEIARKEGIVMLQEDGLLKIIEGISTFDEVIRTTGPIPWYADEKKPGED